MRSLPADSEIPLFDFSSYGNNRYDGGIFLRHNNFEVVVATQITGPIVIFWGI
jgi:hypothetical protein